MLEKLQEYENAGRVLREQWESFIDNTRIELDLRWAVFLKAPTDWKSSDMFGSMPYKVLDELGIDSPYDDLHIDRYGTNKASDDVSTIENLVKYPARGIVVTDETVAALKEEIISMRLHEWKWDW